MKHEVPDVQVKSRAEWRGWLASHHASSGPIWLVTFKKHHPGYVSYAEIVEEALCFGWIDSTQRPVDGDRSKLYLTPRKAGSIWSALNKQRVAVLEASGLMTPAGRAVIERAQADGSWSLLDDIDNLTMPDDLGAALDADAAARVNWEAFSPSVRKQFLWWVKSAKRDATRQARIEGTVGAARENVRVPGKA
ncbi:MAG: YdeI/OmpD-associated family protein [Dehalococcoidia bacterium]|nr:YdeI/OmpD-associated family protein [Dehalococcoidia bacterium]